jgi:hypothetical protein
MEPSRVLAAFHAATDPGPQVTELVPVRPNAHDPSWPPVLVFCVAVVVVGSIVAAVVFLRQARRAGRPVRRNLDG